MRGSSLALLSPSVPSPDFSIHANEHLEVYVSASENPGHFWIQIIGSRALQLDKLAREMTQYYESGDGGMVSPWQEAGSFFPPWVETWEGHSFPSLCITRPFFVPCSARSPGCARGGHCGGLLFR